MAGDSGEPERQPRPFDRRRGSRTHPEAAGRSIDEEEAQLLPEEGFELDEGPQRLSSPQSRPTGRPRTSRLRRGIRDFFRLDQPPLTQTITPIWPAIQGFLPKLLDSQFPDRTQKAAVLALFLCCWLIAFSLPLALNATTGRDASGEPIMHLDCVDAMWSRANECGLDGVDCQPFSNASFAFHCPANCASVVLLNPRAVGGRDINYHQMVVGGPVYRGDSFICQAAIHAGVIRDADGGCGVVTRVGQHADFRASKENGIESVAFDSHFPLAFTVSREPAAQLCGRDTRQTLLVISLAFSTLFSLGTASPVVFFFVTFVAVFAQVGLASDPPSVSRHSTSVLPELVSALAARLLPSLFCAVVIYGYCVKRSLDGLKAHVEKTVLWLGGCWFGALSNYTFAWMPISRLTKHDLETQPGALMTLLAILVVLCGIILQQAYYICLEGRLRALLAFYGIVLFGILAGISLPGLEIRLHHYIIALMLLPGTAMQTRPSLLYQGFLVGLFINGIARWNFDSLFQTAQALRGSDGEFGSAVPSISTTATTLTAGVSSLIFSWKVPPASAHYDGISVLVNDVERSRQFFAGEFEDHQTFTWNRSSDLSHPDYFRFAYIRDGGSLDYTHAGTWHANWTWSMDTTM